MGFYQDIRGFFSGVSSRERELRDLDDQITISEVSAGRPRSPRDNPDRRPTAVISRARHQGKVYNPAVPNDRSMFGNVYTHQEYDMASIANAIDTEPIFRRAVEKYVELILKNKYRFIGDNPQAVMYIKRRFEQMALVSSFPTEELIRQIAYQIVTYANVYVSKVRKQKASGGKVRRTFDGKLMIPVAAYFIEDTVSMKLAVKENGDPIGYKQDLRHIGGTLNTRRDLGGRNSRKVKFWSPDNMIHMFYSRKPGLRVGTPLAWPVLDDMRALRKMEQNVELLVFQHTVPLYHYKIGDETIRAQEEEILAMKQELQDMPPNGAIVTPERHEIKAIGAEKKALDVEKYMMYFKQRVYTGLGMSGPAMGEGESASRATADIMDKHLINTTESFQRIISMFVNECMVKEIMAEGGYFWDAMDMTNEVRLWFPPIDVEKQQAKENHYTQMYTQHAVTEREMREEFGREPIKEEQRDDMYFERVAKPLAIIGAVDEAFTEISKEVSQANASKARAAGKPAPKGAPISKGTERRAKTATISAQRQGTNRDRPTNQFGRAAGPVKTPRNPRGTDMVTDHIMSIYRAATEDTIDTYIDHSNEGSFSQIKTSLLKRTVFKISKNDILEKMKEANQNGLLDNYQEDSFSELLDTCFDSIFKRVEKVFDNKDSYVGSVRINSIFDSSKHFIGTIVENKVKKYDLVNAQEDSKGEELDE